MPTWCLPCAMAGRHVESVTEVDGDPMCKPCAEINEQLVGLPGEPIAIVYESPRQDLCRRGCGQPVHRGACRKYEPGPRQARAEIPKPAPVIATVCASETATPAMRRALGELARSAATAVAQTARCPHGCGKQKHRGLCKAGRQARGPISAPMLEERGVLPAKVEIPQRTANGYRIVARDQVPRVPRKDEYGRERGIFEDVVAAKGEAIEVPANSWSAGKSLQRRLQQRAKKQGVKVDWSRSSDNKLFYFWLVTR